MEVNEALIDRLGELSKLKFDADETQRRMKDLNQILDFVEKLNEVNTDGVEPLLFMSQETNALRNDVEAPTLGQQGALKNAPLKDSDYFKVPKVIDKKD